MKQDCLRHLVLCASGRREKASRVASKRFCELRMPSLRRERYVRFQRLATQRSDALQREGVLFWQGEWADEDVQGKEK